jgi:hypothetical protein
MGEQKQKASRCTSIKRRSMSGSNGDAQGWRLWPRPAASSSSTCSPSRRASMLRSHAARACRRSRGSTAMPMHTLASAGRSSRRDGARTARSCSARLAAGDRARHAPRAAIAERIRALAGAAAHGPVRCGALRDASAIAGHANALGRPVTVIGAGECWPDGTLRPALEDALGAGAIVSALPDRARGRGRRRAVRSPARDLHAFLTSCASGRERVERGFASDVALAAEHDASAAVPWLRDGEYGDARIE